jgi:hypothetical protein
MHGHMNVKLEKKSQFLLPLAYYSSNNIMKNEMHRTYGWDEKA